MRIKINGANYSKQQDANIGEKHEKCLFTFLGPGFGHNVLCMTYFFMSLQNCNCRVVNWLNPTLKKSNLLNVKSKYNLRAWAPLSELGFMQQLLANAILKHVFIYISRLVYLSVHKLFNDVMRSQKGWISSVSHPQMDHSQEYGGGFGTRGLQICNKTQQSYCKVLFCLKSFILNHKYNNPE